METIALQTQLDSFVFMILFITLLALPATIIYHIGYRIGKQKSNNEIKLEATNIINKIDNVLIKKQNYEINKKYDLRIESNKLKKNIHDLNIRLIHSNDRTKKLEKEISIEKCKLMLINTEIENLKKRQ